MFDKIALLILRLNAFATIPLMEAIKPIAQRLLHPYQMLEYDTQIFGQWIILQGGFNFSPSMKREIARQVWIQVVLCVFLDLLIGFLRKILKMLV